MNLITCARWLVVTVALVSGVASQAGAALPEPAAAGPERRVAELPGAGPGQVEPAGQAVGTAPLTTRVQAPLPTPGPDGLLTTTGGGYVALTFDDGPDPRWTPEVLRLLREHRVRATFCLVGERAAGHPDLVRAIVDQGHTLCNHSWSHDLSLGTRSPAEIRADLDRTAAAIEAAVPGEPVPYFRAPGGHWTPRLVEAAGGSGMVPLHWTVDPQDWREPGSLPIAITVVAATGPGAVVLLHDGGGDRGGTVRALSQILPDLTGRLALDALPRAGGRSGG